MNKPDSLSLAVMAKFDSKDIRRFSVLGVQIAATKMSDVISLIETWIAGKACARYIILGGMHGLMEAHRRSDVRRAMQTADLVVPDGMPLVWLGRLHKLSPTKRRVYGPELMREFCKITQGKYKHFLYGGNEGVATQLAQVLTKSFGTHVVGTITPPFRPQTEIELLKDIAAIHESEADVIWVGMSTPKQDLLMHRIRPHLKPCVMLGVGAAFDFNTGLKKTAPPWIQDHGLEWAFRLINEPSRLWFRYLVLGPQFVALASIDFIKQKISQKIFGKQQI